MVPGTSLMSGTLNGEQSFTARATALARTLQASFLPPATLEVPGLDVAGWELYDLRTDPYQLNNVFPSADKGHVKNLSARLAEASRGHDLVLTSGGVSTGEADYVKDAIGAAGYDTPTGLYSIQSKEVNPTWHVPDSEWAGELAIHRRRDVLGVDHERAADGRRRGLRIAHPRQAGGDQRGQPICAR